MAQLPSAQGQPALVVVSRADGAALTAAQVEDFLKVREATVRTFSSPGEPVPLEGEEGISRATLARAAEMRAAFQAGRDLGTFRRLRFDLRLYDRPTQRLRFLLRTLLQPSPADRLRFPLPRPLAFLHPPLRLIRLLWKHGTRPFRKA